MTEEDLAKLSLIELLELQKTLHKAIRAKIHAQQQAMKTRHASSAQAEQSTPATTSLAQDRDAWMARRRSA